MILSKQNENLALVDDLIKGVEKAIEYEGEGDELAEAVMEAGLITCLKAIQDHGNTEQRKKGVKLTRKIAKEGFGRQKIRAVLLLLGINTKSYKADGDWGSGEAKPLSKILEQTYADEEDDDVQTD